MHFPASLHLPTDAFDTASNQIIGRRIAGRLLTKAFAANLAKNESLTIFSSGPNSATQIKELLAGSVPRESTVHIKKKAEPSLLEDIGAIHFPEPSLNRWSALRQGLSPTAFSLTGVIHTICSEGALRDLGEIPLSPVYPWDAIICTSQTGRQVVSRVLEHRLETMAARYRQPSTRDLSVGLPQLPVIPLAGPSQQPYEPQLDRESRRLQSRSQLNISPDAFVVTYVGRLSFHSKSHPLALYRGLDELATKHPSRQIVLIECGHIYNSWIDKTYQELRQEFPGIQYRLIGGTEPASEYDKWQALAAADVFTSLADNLQETFGLSLLEAMMAELPLVVTDWNGYRDLVSDGVNGFRIPTADALTANTRTDHVEIEYLTNELTYDAMIGLRSMGVVVDHHALVHAFNSLLSSASLRLRMANASLNLLHSSFSPSAVTSSYRALYSELRERRHSAHRDYSLPPLIPSYHQLFSHYATSSLTDLKADSQVPITDPKQAITTINLSMNKKQMERLSGGRLASLQSLIENNSALSLELLNTHGLTDQQAFAVLAALAKMGIVSFPHA